MQTFRYFLLLFTLSTIGVLQTVANTFDLRDSNEVQLIPATFFEFAISDVQDPNEVSFKPCELDILNFELQESSVWLKFTIRNSTNKKDLRLFVPVSHLDSIVLYKSGASNAAFSGDLVRGRSKKIIDPYHTFELIIEPGKEETFYARVRSKSQLIIPFNVATEQAFSKQTIIRNLFLGGFIGIMIVMFLYNIVIAIFTKSRAYNYYVGYLVTIATAQFGMMGLASYIFPAIPVFNNSLMYLGSGAAGVLSILFVQSFLQLKQKLPWINRLLNLLIISYSVVFVASLWGWYVISYRLISINGISIALLFAICAISLSLRGERKARFYLFAWLGLIIGVVLYTLVISGVMHFTLSAPYFIPAGIIIETVFLSIALADNINQLRKSNERANLRVIEEVSRNEELIRNQNIDLERKVKERTKQLENAINELKDTQSQLVQSEKMASLGVLTAGIAHEINNPINFVTANVLPLRDNIESLNKIVSSYKNMDATKLEEEVARIKQMEEEEEIDIILEETDLLINGIEEGARRTQGIVDGLRTFSRGDGGQNAKSNINEGINSTLSVLKGKLKGIEVEKNLDEQLPLIACQIGKVNQVILNLLNNAGDAIKKREKETGERGRIFITTKHTDNTIQVSIKDEGVGISPESLDKIFEPFYTTKDIGEGTGLGLSISYGIVEEHQGKLEVESKLGEGSTFTMTLPV
jgi:signal transduction histidine kinase